MSMVSVHNHVVHHVSCQIFMGGGRDCSSCVSLVASFGHPYRWRDKSGCAFGSMVEDAAEEEYDILFSDQIVTDGWKKPRHVTSTAAG